MAQALGPLYAVPSAGFPSRSSALAAVGASRSCALRAAGPRNPQRQFWGFGRHSTCRPHLLTESSSSRSPRRRDQHAWGTRPRGKDPDQARCCPTADLFPDPKNNKQCFISGVLPPTTATRVDILLCQWHTRQVTARGSTCPVGGRFHLRDVRAAGGR